MGRLDGLVDSDIRDHIVTSSHRTAVLRLAPDWRA